MSVTPKHVLAQIRKDLWGARITRAGRGVIVEMKDRARIAKKNNVSTTTVMRVWMKLRKERVFLDSIVARPATDPKHSIAEALTNTMVATALTAPVLPGPAPRSTRSTEADVYPTVAVHRTRSSVIIVFDVNAGIADVISTVANAWQTARGG